LFSQGEVQIPLKITKEHEKYVEIAEFNGNHVKVS